MNYPAMMLSAFGLVSIATIYYFFLRNLAAKPAESKLR